MHINESHNTRSPAVAVQVNKQLNRSTALLQSPQWFCEDKQHDMRRSSIILMLVGRATFAADRRTSRCCVALIGASNSTAAASVATATVATVAFLADLGLGT